MSNRQRLFVCAKDPRHGSDDSFLEMWLRRELTRMHEDALKEPVPPELLKLLDPA